MAKTDYTATGRPALKPIIPKEVIQFLIISAALAILFFVGVAACEQKKRQAPVAQQYRFLQRCESGLTAEYKSTRRLPISEVCGPVNYGDYDVAKDESGAGSGVAE